MGGATREFYVEVLGEALRILSLLPHAADVGIEVPDRVISRLVQAATATEQG